MNDDEATYKLKTALALVETLFPNAVQPLAVQFLQFAVQYRLAVTIAGSQLEILVADGL